MNIESQRLKNDLEQISKVNLQYEAPLELRRSLSGVQGRLPSSVLALFYGPSFMESKILLTERSDELPTHAAQVSFPGGVKHGNEMLDVTALRECEEEVGILSKDVELVGSLPSFPTVTGKFEVTPYLGIIENHESLMTNAYSWKLSSEVKIAEWVSVKSLVETRSSETYTLGGSKIESPIFWWDASTGPKKMWGVTGWIFDLILKRYATIKA